MHVLLFYNCVLTVVKYTDMLCYVTCGGTKYSGVGYNWQFSKQYLHLAICQKWCKIGT